MEKDKIVQVLDMSNIMEAAVYERGLIISASINLENMMNIFLAEHFCQGNGKEMEIIETIFATRKYMFDVKRDTILGILEKKNPYIVDGKLLCKNLQEIIAKRNIFAHYQVDLKEKSLQLFAETGTFTFIKVHNSIKYERFSPKDIEDLKELLISCSEIIRDLYKNRNTSPRQD